MIVHIEPDLSWSLELCGGPSLPTNVCVLSDPGASVPRPQAGRGLLGVKMPLNEHSLSFRRRILGGKERAKPWTTTITTGSARRRLGGGTFSYVSFFLRVSLLGSHAFSRAMAKRRPLLVGPAL